MGFHTYGRHYGLQDSAVWSANALCDVGSRGTPYTRDREMQGRAGERIVMSGPYLSAVQMHDGAR